MTARQPLFWTDNTTPDRPKNRSGQGASAYAKQSHVSKLYRTWLKSSRINQTLRDSTSPFVARLTSHRVGTPQDSGLPSTRGSREPHRPGHSKDHEAVLQQIAKVNLFGQYDSILNHGNSDPFDAACLPVTASTQELLYLATHHFVIFSRKAYYLSGALRRKFRDAVTVQQQCGIADTTLMLTLLAGGLCAKAALFNSSQKVLLEQARLLKVNVISRLRKWIGQPDFKAGTNVYHIITNLASIDFAMGEPESALVHHKAVVKMMSSFPYREDDLIPMLGYMAEMCIFKSMVCRPYFNPLQSSESNDFKHIQIDALTRAHICDCDIQAVLCPIVTQCRVVQQSRRAIDSDAANENMKLVAMVARQSLAAEEVLLSIYVAHMELHGQSLEWSLRRTFLKVVAQAGIFFLEVLFSESMDKEYPHGLYQPHRPRVTWMRSHLEWLLEFTDFTIILWVTFIAVLYDRLCPHDNASSEELTSHAAIFALLLNRFHVHSFVEAKALLQTHLYHEECMDSVLQKFWPDA